MNDQLPVSPSLEPTDNAGGGVDAVFASAAHYATLVQVAQRSGAATVDADSTTPSGPVSDDVASAALGRVDATGELSAEDILEAQAAHDEVDVDVTHEEPVHEPAPRPSPVAVAPVAVAPVVTAAVVQRPAPRLRAEDTWQALGRAIGEAHASVILREPSEASRRVPESIYPVEVPVTPPQQSAANMSAPFATWPFREGVEPSAAAPDASLSMQVPVRKPRALSTARWAVGGVTAFAALVCAIALATSNGHVEDGAGVQAAAAPPPQTTVIPQKQASSSVSSSSVKDDPLAAAAIANVSSTSWTKNVLDTPGVSVDALPKADSKPKAPARRATKRH